MINISFATEVKSLLVDIFFLGILLAGIIWREKPSLGLIKLIISLNISIFFVSLIAGRIEVPIGFAFGLFAILGILRFRSDVFDYETMANLVASISIGVISALIKNEMPPFFAIGANFVIVALTHLPLFLKKIYKHKNILINYDRLEYLLPEKKSDLINDIQKKTGLKVKSFSIVQINFLRDSCLINCTIEDDQ